MNIRLLRAADFDNGFVEALSAVAPVDCPIDRLRAAHRRRRRMGVRTFVCEIDGRVVGTASLLVEQKFIHAAGRVGHVEDVAVADGYRGRGIGTRLVRHAAGRARRAGCYKVILHCTDELAGFYERLGYRRHCVGMRVDLPIEVSAAPAKLIEGDAAAEGR
jgi:glucosamine-phosphate N-acetyltransferase